MRGYSRRTAMRHMRKLILELSQIIFMDLGNEKESVFDSYLGGSDGAEAIETAFALPPADPDEDYDGFEFHLEVVPDWLILVDPTDYPSENDLFWLVANAIPGWTASTSDLAGPHPQVYWYISDFSDELASELAFDTIVACTCEIIKANIKTPDAKPQPKENPCPRY